VAPQAAGVADFRAEGGVPVSWSEPFETAVWQISSMRHFGERFRSALADAPGITVLLNANLVQLVDRDDGQSIALARFGTLRGNGFTVAARRYVLACGGIENARLLLAMASERHPTGFGNQSGLVGRFFMEHPEIPVGALVYNEPVPYGLDHFIPTSTGQLAEGFRLANSIQRSAQIADVAFWPLFNVDLTASSELAAELGFPAQDTSSRPDGTSPYNPRMCTILTVSFEQSPNPDSRIKLSDRRDAFGMPQARLDWRLNDLDRRTFATALKIMAREAERQQLGRFWLRLALDGLDLDNPDSIRFDLPLTGPNKATNQLDTELHWGCHHMGTTRMHSDPRRGVVDPQARAHGIANLYIAGSSIFPNVGVSNPTLTIMALALKLADYLRTTTF
jgi:choline dehydrogenase-like flavoprotein